MYFFDFDTENKLVNDYISEYIIKVTNIRFLFYTFNQEYKN